jgi:DNA-binding response OmpR family regulator
MRLVNAPFSMNAEPYSESPLYRSEAGATRVVVAEGDDQLRTQLVQQLTAFGYDVVAMRTGAQLMQYLYNEGQHDQRPDLVICAAELDGILGSQVCKISRAQDSLLPFIVLAREGEAAAFDALELLEDAFVVRRPVDFDELHDAVVELVGEP